RADGSEQNGGVERLRRRRGAGTGPLSPELAGEALALIVALPSEGENPPALVPGDLGDQVSRRAEAVEAEARRVSRGHQRPVTDQPGAEHRGSLGIAVPCRERETVPLVGHGALGVAAVELVAGEPGVGAQVLPSGQTVGAHSAGPAQPGDADPVTRAKPAVR